MARLRMPPVAAAPLVLPVDVRLMNAVSAGVYALALLALLAAGVLWLTRAPWFAIRAIQLEGDLARNNVPTLRADALPRLSGNFFSIDMTRTQAAFEAVPWVRAAVVRRVWPDRLAVRLEEHRPVALWQSDEENPLLVNQQGELFEANVGDVDDENLPVFDGPKGASATMWAMHQRLQPMLTAQRMTLRRLSLSARGSWSVRTDEGQTLALGRGQLDEVVARTALFMRTLPELAGRYHKPLLSADLRHAGGYAVRLQGVKTMAASAPAGKAH